MRDADEQTRSWLNWSTLTLGVVVLVGGLWWFFGLYLPPLLNSELSEQGQRGDAFGMVNALFGGLAFAGLIVAIILQTRELSLQRQDLKETREELSGQRAALEEQVAAAAHQRFDSTFFQMIDLHHQIVRSLALVTNKDPIEGRRAIEVINNRVTARLKGQPKGDAAADLPGLETQLGQITDGYLELYQEYETRLGHYFRNLYRIVKFIDESEIEDKRNYVGILRAQLSIPELSLLFYNMLGPGLEKFLPLVLKYDFLENLPITELASVKHVTIVRRYVSGVHQKHLVLAESVR